MNYLDQLVSWILSNQRLLRVLALAVVVLYQIRAAALIAIAVGLLYWVAPEVRPYWNIAVSYFVLGLKAMAF